jgi:hypothetical protein
VLRLDEKRPNRRTGFLAADFGGLGKGPCVHEYTAPFRSGGQVALSQNQLLQVLASYLRRVLSEGEPAG